MKIIQACIKITIRRIIIEPKLIKGGKIKLKYIPTEKQKAEIF